MSNEQSKTKQNKTNSDTREGKDKKKFLSREKEKKNYIKISDFRKQEYLILSFLCRRKKEQSSFITRNK